MRRWCPELSKLPKAKRLKSLDFRFTTPGSPSHLIVSSKVWTVPRHELVDPTHPAARLYSRAHLSNVLPSWRSPELGLRLIPKAILERPKVFFACPPFGRREREAEGFRGAGEGEGKGLGHWIRKAMDGTEDVGADDDAPPPQAQMRNAGRVPMSVQCVGGIKSIHKKSTVRRTISRRLKTALALVVVRGARVERPVSEGDGRAPRRPRVVLDDEAIMVPDILHDWTYAFYPAITLFSMPYTDMIEQLRVALGVVHQAAKKLELSWQSHTEERSSQYVRQTPTEEESDLTEEKPRHGQAHAMLEQAHKVEEQTHAAKGALEADSAPEGTGGKKFVWTPLRRAAMPTPDHHALRLTPRVAQRIRHSLGWMELSRASMAEIAPGLDAYAPAKKPKPPKKRLEHASQSPPPPPPAVAEDTHIRSHAAKLFQSKPYVLPVGTRKPRGS